MANALAAGLKYGMMGTSHTTVRIITSAVSMTVQILATSTQNALVSIPKMANAHIGVQALSAQGQPLVTSAM